MPPAHPARSHGQTLRCLRLRRLDEQPGDACVLVVHRSRLAHRHRRCLAVRHQYIDILLLVSSSQLL